VYEFDPMTRLSIVVSSSIKNVSAIERFAEQIRRHYEISTEKYPDILISLTEAVNNAIVHGNNEDSKKLVSVASSKTKNGLVITVSDEGNGFNHSCLPDPTTPENICACGGRGVFLMKELCDRISFVNNGSTVKLFFSV